jgi:SAM-dependent methyltransferase
MFRSTVPYYDAIHSYKNYEGEVARLNEILHHECPRAKSVLDVGCGTGEHARRLSRRFRVQGIDVEPAFIEAARRKVPTGRFEVADMRHFEMERDQDAIVCLFSSIAYLTDPADVIRALRCFAAHLSPSGIVVVEPWFTPDSWRFLEPFLAPSIDTGEIKIAGVTFSRQDGNDCVIDFHYLIGQQGGITHVAEKHRLAMYTREQMLHFFSEAGISAEYDADAFGDRGLYIGRHK